MQRRFAVIIGCLVALVMMALTFWLQTYRLCEYEESHLMLYHWPWVTETLGMVGGVAQLVASFFTQFMLVAWTGPLLTGILYFLIAYSLCSVGDRMCMPRWSALLVAIPCLFEMMSIANANFAYRGLVAYALACLGLWLFCSIDRWRPLWGCVICAAIYYAAGSIALPLAVAMIISELTFRFVGSGDAKSSATKSRHGWLWILMVIPLLAVEGWVCWRSGRVDSIVHAFTPRMYYENPGPYVMQLYAWASLALFPLVVWVCRSIKLTGKGRYVGAVIVVALVLGSVLPFAGVVFHPAIERGMKERYLAKQGRWDDILAIDYGNMPTEIFSYRTLALAHKGLLTRELAHLNPQFTYFQGHKPYSHKTEAQMLSDVFYDCSYMGEARHRAFNANLVTPGALNPEETKKLVLINIAYGNYEVADKLLAQLDKTLFYSDWAQGHRQYLYNDEAVITDSVLGPMRRAIPATNSHMSPQSTLIDLRRIAENDSTQTVARQYFDAISLLVTGAIPTPTTK